MSATTAASCPTSPRCRRSARTGARTPSASTPVCNGTTAPPSRSLDVAFTIDHILASDFQGDSRLQEAWTGVEVRTPDLRTIVIRLPEPNASFLARFATVGILPEHLLQGLDGADLFDAPFNASPVGAGPYRLESATSVEATLSAYPRYHLGRPHIDVITVRFLPDFAAVKHALEEGDIDGIFLRQPLNTEQLASLDDIDGFVHEDLQRAVSLVLYLNNSQVAYFRDPRVRTAVSLALDRQTLVENALLGVATPSSSAIAPGTWAYDPSLDSPPSDPEAAIALLAEAGWHRSPTTGVLVRQGSEFRLTIRTDNDPRHLALAREVALQLEPVGIRATVASTSFTVLSRDFLAPRTYDAALAGWDQAPTPTPTSPGTAPRSTTPGATSRTTATSSLMPSSSEGAPPPAPSYASTPTASSRSSGSGRLPASSSPTPGSATFAPPM